MSKIVRGDSMSSPAPLRHAVRKAFPDLSFQAALKAESHHAWPAWTRRVAFAAPVDANRWPAWTDSVVISAEAELPPAGPLFAKEGGRA
ncbi:hypothetical protein [Singulisphaera sp. PoT]|uniref:hypothetical protein n=1 Tax=Singulisphaera sp. PoT TaxID=3411797 RepID=UPI003BF561DD